VRLAVWAVEWRLAQTRRRLFVLNTALPLALVLPVATGAIPAQEAASVYVFVFSAFAAIGSAVPLRWEGERGMSARIVLGGMSPSSYLLQRTAAGAVRDVVQLMPALVAIAVAAHASIGDALLVFVGLTATCWIGGLMGVVAAAVTRSLVEAVIVATVIVISLAEMSGVFYTPAPGSVGAALEAVSPFRGLHERLLDMTVGAPTSGGMAEIAWAVLLPAVVAMFAVRLHASLGRVSQYGLEGV
jgi:ABC-2 type transporter